MAKLTGTGVSGSDIFCTARVKSYPGGRCEALVCDKAIFGGSGWEARQGSRVKEARAKDGGHDVARAVRRARAQVRDIALCTPFRWFVTLTLDPARVNRYDVREVTRHLNHWLDNQVRRKGLAYVLVPERHKDGAIHFHGFFNDALEARDNGDGLEPQKIGGRWYYSGGALGRPQVTYAELDFRQAEQEPGAYRFDLPQAGISFVQFQFQAKGGENSGEPVGKVTGSQSEVPMVGAVRQPPLLGLRPGVRGAQGGGP